MIYFKRLIFLLLISMSCQSAGKLKIEADITNGLKEVSAAELDLQSDILWVIEDAGNRAKLIGLNAKGKRTRTIKINNAKNNDWEDLTSDKQGNIYIGDFGNNNEKRKKFKILKVKYADLSKDEAIAEIIEFTLPKKQGSKDFEAFFIYNSTFYIISKETNKFSVFKVPNVIGKHKAEAVTEHKFKGKNNRITAADISADGKTIVLLNHDKLWKLTDFKTDNFFSGTIEKHDFNHNSQKEGICFKTNSSVIITDERQGSMGGNIYSFKLD
jgi:hypothetical protein